MFFAEHGTERASSNGSGCCSPGEIITERYVREVKLLCSSTSFIFNTRLPLHSPSHRECLTPQLCYANLRSSGCQEVWCSSHHLHARRGCVPHCPTETFSSLCPWAECSPSSSDHQSSIWQQGSAVQCRQGGADLRGENTAPASLEICMFVIKMFWGYFCFSVERQAVSNKR